LAGKAENGVWTRMKRNFRCSDLKKEGNQGMEKGRELSFCRVRKCGKTKLLGEGELGHRGGGGMEKQDSQACHIRGLTGGRPVSFQGNSQNICGRNSDEGPLFHAIPLCKKRGVGAIKRRKRGVRGAEMQRVVGSGENEKKKRDAVYSSDIECRAENGKGSCRCLRGAMDRG